VMTGPLHYCAKPVRLRFQRGFGRPHAGCIWAWTDC
jgi:hypothetical protein